MDYAKLYLDGDRLAAYLSLRGVADAELADRVRAGQRRTAGFEACGKVEVCTAGEAHGQLYTNNLPSGELHLRMRPGPGGSDVFSGVWAGCQKVDRGPALPAQPAPAWGFVRIRALDRTGLVAHNIVELATDNDHRRGSVRIHDADAPEKRAVLEIDDEGPILYLTDGERSIAITPSGILQNPDKAADRAARLRDVPGGVGADLGQHPDFAELDAAAQGFELALVADHPHEPTMQIHYNVLEGGEVGVYLRGTTRLAAGRALVQLDEHFRHVASEQGLTVQLTPRSAHSKGVAACQVSTRSIEIVELFGGGGDYDVDWTVNGLRRGREGFEVIRPRRAVSFRGARQGAERADGADRHPEARSVLADGE